MSSPRKQVDRSSSRDKDGKNSSDLKHTKNDVKSAPITRSNSNANVVANNSIKNGAVVNSHKVPSEAKNQSVNSQQESGRNASNSRSQTDPQNATEQNDSKGVKNLVSNLCHECGKPPTSSLPLSKCQNKECTNLFCYKCVSKYEIDSYTKEDFKRTLDNPKICPVCKKECKCRKCNFENNDDQKSNDELMGKRRLRNREARKTPKGHEFYEQLQRRKERKKISRQHRSSNKSASKSKTSTPSKVDDHNKNNFEQAVKDNEIDLKYQEEDKHKESELKQTLASENPKSVPELVKPADTSESVKLVESRKPEEEDKSIEPPKPTAKRGRKRKNKTRIGYNYAKRAKYKKARELKLLKEREKKLKKEHNPEEVKRFEDASESVDPSPLKPIRREKTPEPQPTMEVDEPKPLKKEVPKEPQSVVVNSGSNRREQKAFEKSQDEEANYYQSQRPYYEQEVQNRTRFARRSRGYYEYEPVGMPRYEYPPYIPRDDYYMYPEYNRCGYANYNGMNFRIMPIEIAINESSYNIVRSNEQVHFNSLAGCFRQSRTNPFNTYPDEQSEVMLVPMRVFKNGHGRMMNEYYYREQMYRERQNEYLAHPPYPKPERPSMPGMHVVEQSDSFSMNENVRSKNRNLPVPKGY